MNAMINLDAGSVYCGEFAIGTNYGIAVPTGHILVDEKMGGTVHMALGNGYPLTGSTNVSALHWDFVCDLRRGGRVEVDGDAILEDGRILV
jgi:aminopeptidase